MKNAKTPVSNCETCEFYDYDEYLDGYVCSQNLDQDERGLYLVGQTRGCPYYRYHDEYATVRKQN